MKRIRRTDPRVNRTSSRMNSTLPYRSYNPSPMRRSYPPLPFRYQHPVIFWVMVIATIIIIAIIGETAFLYFSSGMNQESNVPQQQITKNVKNNNQTQNNSRTNPNHQVNSREATKLSEELQAIAVPDQQQQRIINAFNRLAPAQQKAIYKQAQRYYHTIPTATLKRHLLNKYLKRYHLNQ